MQTRRRARSTAAPIPSVNGFRVFRGAVKVAAEDLLRLRAAAINGNTIFNPDALRVQRSLDQTDAFYQTVVSFLESERLVEGRMVGPAVTLHSFAGCQRQHLHTDFDVADVTRARTKPLGVLVALQDQTALYIGGTDVALSAGDMLVFDGDVVHAGAAFESCNTRVHFYLDSYEVPRDFNRTYFADERAEGVAEATGGDE